MKLRIAFVSLTNCVGGAENILLYLHKYHHRNSVLYFLSKKCNTSLESQQVHFFSETKSLVFGILGIIFRFNELNRYDYIFSSHQYLNAFLGLLKRIHLLKKPALIFRESTSIFLRVKGIKLLSYRISYLIGYGSQHLIVTQTELMKNQLLRNVKKSCDWKIVTLPNPLNIFEIKEKSNEYKVYDENFIVSAGRLIPEKGFDVLIKSYNQIKEEINYKKLLIFGDGPEKEKLKQLIHDLNLTKDVTLMGHITNPMPYFKDAELCVVSSRIEGFPNVLLQMMALNGNVISTLCAGGIENLNGLLTCAPNDVDALAATIINSLKYKIDSSELFLNELKKRSISNYWNTIQKSINENV